MSDQRYLETGFVNSLIGEGTSFRGDVQMEGLLRIDGDVIGNIDSKGKILIGKTGRAKSSIHATTVVIGGVVKGNIYADEKVVLLSSGMVIGDIFTPRLIAEDGVIIHGECVIDEDALEISKKRRAARENAGNNRFNSGKEVYNPARRTSWTTK
jgi:cytoskeletal protein CcmA (bactofilin family)